MRSDTSTLYPNKGGGNGAAYRSFDPLGTDAGGAVRAAGSRNGRQRPLTRLGQTNSGVLRREGRAATLISIESAPRPSLSALAPLLEL